MQDIIMSNAIIKIREKNLLSSEKIKRMFDAEDFNGAVRILYESGYADGKTFPPNEYAKLADAEVSLALNTFHSLCADKTVHALFFTRFLYHNAKALYKGKWVKLSKTDALYVSDGLPNIADAIENSCYASLPAELGRALSALDIQFADAPPIPSQIDFAIDKAMYQNIARLLKKVGNTDVKKYYTAEMALTNIGTAFRAKLLKLSQNALSALLIPNVNTPLCLEILLKDLDSLARLSPREEYGELISLCAESLKQGAGVSSFEKHKDRLLLQLARKNNDDYFKINPLFSYAQSKLAETQAVKTILSGKYNHLNKDVVSARLRDIYA